MKTINKVSVLGAGLIGASWSSLFLAAGHEVAVYDPAKNAENHLRNYIRGAWTVLRSLGLTSKEGPGPLSFHGSAVAAVKDADFVQESVPEKLDLKHALYAEIEPQLKYETIVASSASGLTVSDMQQGWRDPSRLLIGHPFNPPHLIPLVELMTNEQTRAVVLETAEAFYQHAGKVTIRVKSEARKSRPAREPALLS